jgi:hypothetical protein
MKLIIAGFLSLFALTANAGGIDCRHGVDHKHPACFARPAVVHVQHRHGHHHYRHHAPVIVHRHHDNWVAPLVGGVILGAIITDANKERVERERVIVQSVPVNPSNCTEWKEIMTTDGKIYRERTCKE